MLDLKEVELKKQFSFFDDAPDAVAVVSVGQKNNKPTDYKIIYINGAVEKISGFSEEQLLDKNIYAEVKKCYADKKTMCYRAAYFGERSETTSQDKTTSKYTKTACWQIKEGYCGFIITDITDKHSLETAANKQYKKLEILLKNSMDFIFELDIDTSTIHLEDYSEEKNRLIEKEYQVPDEWIRRELITKKSAERMKNIIKEIQNGSDESSVKIELRKNKKEQFEWYQMALYAYKESQTDKKSVMGYAKNIHKETMLLSELQEKANKDLMTGIYNVTAAKKRIKKVLDTTSCNAFFIVDIDDFKSINDTYGHPCGDQAIRLVAKVLNGSFRHSDIVYRLGGDEFGGLAVGVSNEKHIKIMCNDIRNALANNKIIECPISVSIGISLNKSGNATYEEYYDTADKALYKAKSQGKNGYYIEYL